MEHSSLRIPDLVYDISVSNTRNTDVEKGKHFSLFFYFLGGKADCGTFWLCSVHENNIPFIIAHAKIWIVDVNLLIFILNSHRGCPVRSCIVEVKLCSQHLRSLRQFTFLLCKFQNACHKTQVTNVLSE